MTLLSMLTRTRRRTAARAAAALLARADAARDAGEFAAAATLYAEVVAADPANADIHIQCGHMYKEAGQLDLSETHYLKARDLRPDDPDLLLQFGHFYKVAGRHADAVTAYRAAETLAPGWPEPLEELAALGALPAAGFFTNNLLAQADAARDALNFANAAFLYEQVLATDPSNAAIQIQCGHMHKEAGEFALAETHYRQAQTLTPDNAELHLQLGHFYKLVDRQADAIAAYRTASRLAPGWQAPLDELAALSCTAPVQLAASPRLHPALPRQSSIVVADGPLPPKPPLLFDDAFYLANNPDLMRGQDPWVHFVLHGAAERRDPHFLFSVSTYLSALDVAHLDENPLLHFLRIGRAEGRQFHWLFSLPEYQRLHPGIGGDPLDHFLHIGLRQNLQPHPLFDTLDYLERYPGVATAMPAFEHFLKHGDAEGKSPGALFDPAHYRQQYRLPPGTPAFEHYMRLGRRHDPHQLFSGGYYLEKNPLVDASGANPLHHYIAVGAAEGRAPHPLFDVRHYLRQTSAPAARANPLLHYVTTGAAQSLSPHPLFDPAYYRDRSARSWTGAPLPRSGPRISILVPVYNTPPGILAECIESVRKQTYASWELCLIDDASPDHSTVAMLESYQGLDERIKVVRSSTNLHIAGATNMVAEQATGVFLAFLDHDDTIHPHALAEVALAVMGRPDIDLLYTDEDKIDPSGRHVDTYYKPDWSPDHLWSVMYVLHFLVIRKSLFWQLGGLRAERSGAQDYDLALRATREARHVHHIPRVLYHWRMIPGSASAEVDAKPYALIAAREALQDAVTASGAVATVEDGLLQGTFRVRYSLSAEPAVTLLVFTNDSERDVPGRGRINMVRHFLRSIAERTTYRKYKIVVVDNSNASVETQALVAELGGQILSYTPEARFNYARKANFATRRLSTEHVIYLNDDLEVITPDWIEALLELSHQPNVGGVGARLLYPNDTVQHAGIVLGINDNAAHVFLNLPRNQVGYNGYTHLIRNYSAVTGAVFATRREVMEAAGGFDEKLGVDFNDIDLCLRLWRQSRRILFTPYCEMYHFEGSTQVRTSQAPEEAQLFHSRWRDTIRLDPYYNPNASRDRLNFV